jgi:hypothetical protein
MIMNYHIRSTSYHNSNDTTLAIYLTGMLTQAVSSYFFFRNVSVMLDIDLSEERSCTLGVLTLWSSDQSKQVVVETHAQFSGNSA